MEATTRALDMVTDNPNNRKTSTIIAENGNPDGPVDYNKAITTTRYGTFNVLLLLCVLPIAWTAVFDTTTGAFILASAECDFQLTFVRKGVLVSFPYIAMLMTSHLWDHVEIYVGKRTLFVLGLLADSVLNILSTAVTSYYVFLLVKFISGIIVGGPLAMAMTYLTEFHAPKYKPQFSRWVGFLFAVPNMVPAALAFIILPLDWNIDVFGRNYTTWRIYLLICSIPPVLGLLTASMLPESPKYLMTMGRSEDALKLFRRMYSMNTGQPLQTFPIKALLAPQKAQLPRPVLKATLEKLRLASYNAKLLFSSPYLPALLFISFFQFTSMLGFNLMRLWVPHLFIILNNFDYENWAPDGRAPTMCEMLDRRTAMPARNYWNCTTFDDACIKWVINPAVYQNSTIIASSAILFGFLFGFITTTKFRKKVVLFSAFLISMVSSFGINWAQAPPYMLTLHAAIIVTTRIAGNIVTAVNVDVVPIPLRATSVSILTAIGNLGAIVGNLIFTALLEVECLAAYLELACLFLVCMCISFFLPDPVKPRLVNNLTQVEAQK